MKIIMVLLGIVCMSTAMATTYEQCANEERSVFHGCLSIGWSSWENSTPPEAVKGCAEAYKVGLQQCKEIYIQKGGK